MLVINSVLFPCSYNLTLWRAVPCLRWSVTSLSLWRPGFCPRPVDVEFVVDRVVLRQVFFLVLQFWPVIIIPPVLNTLSFIHSFIHSSIVDTVCSLQLTALLNNTLKILCGCCLYTVLLAIFLLGVTLQNIYCLNKECALF